jgi:hypothetical protein
MPTMKDLYGWKTARGRDWRRHGTVARLDLEEYRIEPVAGMRGMPLHLGPDECYYVEEDLDRENERFTLRFFRLHRGILTLLHDFGDFPPGQDRRSIDYQFTPHGLIWQEGRRVTVFLYPDLNELEFSGLG